MILEPTVLVLGAGASVPYGFPSGEKLMQSIWTKIQSDDTFRSSLLDSRFAERDLTNFANALEHEDRFSLDAFLETKPHFLEVGKAAIALSLIPCENDSNLNARRPDGWHRYFFNEMLHGGPPGVPPDVVFKLNRLTVVTFNFDRSFERGLFSFLKRVLNLTPAGATELAKVVPVWHVHGDLGAPDWLLAATDECRRPFGLLPGTSIVSPTDIRQCAERIRLVTDELPDDDPAFRGARFAIAEAEKVVFMGFAFDHRNLQRLGLEELREKGSRPGQLYGTSYGLNPAHTFRVKRTFPQIKLKRLKAHEFVEQSRVLHGVFEGNAVPRF